MFVIILLVYSLRGVSHAAPLSITIREAFTPVPPSPPACTCTNQRSIWDIIWSCLATIFACSWVSIHPNIPGPKEKSWRITLRRVGYMFWTILAPELVIYWAMRQYFGARRIAERFRDRGWTTTHGHFLQMGGFLLFEGGEPKGSLAHNYGPRTFEGLVKRKRIKFPTITKEDIDYHSKSDGLAKCLVIVQTGWFVLQCIARWVEGLVITEIELVTLALAALNASMYFFWWHKPFDVRTHVPVELLDPPSNIESEESEAVQLEDRWIWGISFQNIADFILRMLIIAFFNWPKASIKGIFNLLAEIAEWHPGLREEHLQVPMFYSSPALSYTDDSKLLGLASLVGVHFLFPTRTELIIWRTCSILITALPTLLLAHSLASWLPYSNWTVSRIIENICTIGSPIYFVARLALLVEAGITLRNLPEGAYAVLEWTNRLPHV
ncbi:hypothetical protein BYT27DRAFT_7235694 [Phlegmacium glaucopus]|nr:hypothetical protein BYT27DRAFT_7235694 [Phlegmacium glaucopus]